MTKERKKGAAAIRFPIYLTLGYLIFTHIIYVLCPYNWPTKKPVLFYILNVLYIAALVGGYFLGTKKSISIKVFSPNKKNFDRLILAVSILSIVNFLVYLIHVFRSYGLATPDFISLVKNMFIGLRNPGYGYYLNFMRQQTLDGSMVLGGKLFTLFNLGWSFLELPIIILGILYFKKLRLYGKIFTVAYMVLVVVFYISIGTNIQFFYVLLFLLLPIILATFDKWHSGTLNANGILKLVACMLIGVLLMGCYFIYMIQSRTNIRDYDIDSYQIGDLKPQTSASKNEAENEPTEPAPTDVQSSTPAATTPPAPTPKPAPKKTGMLEKLWISASSYLTQGYYGMSQALTVEWTPMFGVGNSMFLVNLISGNVADIDQYTYQVKLEPFGWDSDVRWHSMYTWIANDVSFYGVILIMFLIGALFGMMFRDAIVTKNPFARASIFFFILMMVFIPCNHQVGQTSDALFGFLLLIGMWLLCKKEPDPEPETLLPEDGQTPEIEEVQCQEIN